MTPVQAVQARLAAAVVHRLQVRLQQIQIVQEVMILVPMDVPQTPPLKQPIRIQQMSCPLLSAGHVILGLILQRPRRTVRIFIICARLKAKQSRVIQMSNIVKQQNEEGEHMFTSCIWSASSRKHVPKTFSTTIAILTTQNVIAPAANLVILLEFYRCKF